MIGKTDTSFSVPKENIPKILLVSDEENDLNFQDVSPRDIPRYLPERYWIKQSRPIERWKNHNIISCGAWRELRLADLGRKLDDPGDAFYELFLSTHRSVIHFRTWYEATEVFLRNEQAKKVKIFIREYNGLRGKGEIDADEFLKTLDLGPPDPRMQQEMADRVIAAIVKKAEKGREKGAYRSLVRDYGRGQLVVGLPLWFATFPADPTDPSTVLKDFFTRLEIGFEAIKHSGLLTSWCPFDSVLILWNPTLESIDEWTKVADPDFYLDPANISWKTPVSFLKLSSLVEKCPPNSSTYSARWDRYSSLGAMLIDQRRWLRFPNNPRPLGPKACLEINDLENRNGILRMRFYNWFLQLSLFVRINGWRGLHRWVASRFSVRRLYSRLLLSHEARKLHRSSTSNHSKSNDNDHIGELE